MKTSPASVLSLLLATPLLLECSLMSLDDFSARRCRSDADCEPAQRAFGDAARCAHYECREGSCAPAPRVESCNREDDDCDGLIDDELSVVPHELLGESIDSAVMASAVSPSGATAYVVGGADVATGVGAVGVNGILVSGTIAEPASPLVYASAAALGELSDRPCPVMTSTGVAAAGCRFDDVALAADEQQLVYATINTVGCARGQLRVGLAAASAPFRIWLGSSPTGAAPQSNVEVGVDVDVDVDDGRCSGASARNESEGAAGARSPAVAALDLSPGAAGALVTWLAASHAPLPLAPCGTPVDAPVHALGVLVPEQARYADQRWLVGSDGGAPLAVGRTSSVRPPAVVGLSASGSTGRYLLAFPSRKEGADGVALVRVTIRGEQLSSTDAGFIEDEAPDLVSLGVSSNGDTAAIVWRSGCGATSPVKLAVLTLAAGTLPRSSPLSFPAENIYAKPQLLHRPAGFTTRKEGGGWFVVWSEKMKGGRGRTRLARVTDEPSALDAEPSTVTSGAVGLPLLFPDRETTVNQGLLIVSPSEAPQAQVYPGWCELTEPEIGKTALRE